jgi:hypothetical protein
MSELNKLAAKTLRKTMVLLGDAQLQMLGSDVMGVAGALSELQTLYIAIDDNTLRLTNVEQEAGPEPEEKADVAAD